MSPATRSRSASRAAWSANGGSASATITNETRGTILASRARFALSGRERARGLLGLDRLPEGEALVFPRCSQVHTFGMRFAIDVLFLDGEGRVVHMVRGMAPRRITRWCARGRTVVELPEGAIDASGTGPGDTLALCPPAG